MSLLPLLPRAALALAASAALLGCNAAPKAYSTTTAMWAVPASLDELSQETFYDHPWPSDLRVENGAPRFTGFYNPNSNALLGIYVKAAHNLLDGFSPAAAGYLRFTGPIDPASLPADPQRGLDPASPVQLIDIDPFSPGYQERRLISLSWHGAEGVYYRENTLAFMPTVGFPLRPRTRYALVITDDLQAEGGGAVAQHPDLAKIVKVTEFDARTRVAAAALWDAVDEIEAAGVGRERIVHLAVFTTADPTKELMTVRDAVASQVPAPKVDASTWQPGKHAAEYDEYTGRYGPTPNYQQGTLPFAQYGDGGNFVLQGGVPVLQDTFELRFSLAVPNAAACPMPAKGYPIVLYAHGTGGDYRSYLDDGTARSLAEKCLASMGIDQIFHGDRPGAPQGGDETQIGLLFFNFQNPVAARTNGRQAAIDEVQRTRLFTDTKLTVPSSVTVDHREVRFDASRLMFFGHSQGGLNGPLYTAVDPAPLGAVFSGSGAMISVALLEKTEPQPSPAGLVRTLLGLNGEAGAELDLFHPTMMLATSLVDAVDTLHYARLQQSEPREGFAPKSVYMTEGINPDGVGDSYAPPHGIEAHGMAVGLPLQLPGEHPIVELEWGGPPGVTVPAAGLAGNLGGGRASGVLAQWAVPLDSDGHFVVFDVPRARAQAAVFLQNLAKSPIGRVPAP